MVLTPTHVLAGPLCGMEMWRRTRYRHQGAGQGRRENSLTASLPCLPRSDQEKCPLREAREAREVPASRASRIAFPLTVSP